MRLAVIGSDGFVGRAVTAAALADRRITSLHLLDTRAPPGHADGRVRTFAGSFADPALRAECCAGADAVIHLAAVLGAAAEQDYAAARAANVDATLSLFEHLRETGPGRRVVFASTVAVYGPHLPDPVTDATPFDPVMVYGAQKLMMEVALSNFSARGWLDGISLRPSGIVARPGEGQGLKSAFMSELFHAVAAGRDITLPVGPDAQSWFISVARVAEGLLHAATLPRIPGPRALNMPALRLRYDRLIAALRRRFPDSPSRVRHAPDPEITALFGAYPAIETEAARRLGLRGDDTADALVRAVFEKGVTG